MERTFAPCLLALLLAFAPVALADDEAPEAPTPLEDGAPCIDIDATRIPPGIYIKMECTERLLP